MRDQAGYFADRVIREAGDEPDKQAELVLLIGLSRRPSPQRVRQAVAFLQSQSERLTAEGVDGSQAQRKALADLCHVVMNLSEFVYVD